MRPPECQHYVLNNLTFVGVLKGNFMSLSASAGIAEISYCAM
jgi:hypothetical protein